VVIVMSGITSIFLSVVELVLFHFNAVHCVPLMRQRYEMVRSPHVRFPGK
jgi:hypothetical protein